jgi:hypothetical protein
VKRLSITLLICILVAIGPLAGAIIGGFIEEISECTHRAGVAQSCILLGTFDVTSLVNNLVFLAWLSIISIPAGAILFFVSLFIHGLSLIFSKNTDKDHE